MDKQVKEMMSKSKKRVHILSRLKRFRIPREDLVAVYKSYVRPALEYAAPVWHPGLTKLQTSALEKIQKRAMRIVLGAELTYTTALKEASIETLEERRHDLCTKFAEACVRSHIYSNVFPLNDTTHSMQLRTSRTYKSINARTKRYQNSSIPFLTTCLNE